jgi:hypothetical protein
MFSLSPIAISVVIAGVLAIVGIVITATRRGVTFSGYESVTQDLDRIRRFIRGQVSRDGKDLVIRGEYRSLPATVRFSHEEHTPGLHVRMAAPATFSLYIAEKKTAARGRVSFRVGDQYLDTRFVASSDTAAEARMFTSGKAACKVLRSLCCSTRTFLTIEPGAMELAEAAIPHPYTGAHVVSHIRAIGQLAEFMQQMPGADAVGLPQIKRSRSIAARAAMAVGLVAAVVTVVSATFQGGTVAPVAAAESAGPPGMDSNDAMHISGLRDWHLADESDFDLAGVRWMRDNHQEVAGRSIIDFKGDGGGDTVYVLTRADHSFRIIMMSSGQVTYDATFASLMAVARMPKRDFPGVQWSIAASSDPDGDGLVLVAHREDPASAVILFSHDGKIVSGSPADYQTLNLD